MYKRLFLISLLFAAFFGTSMAETIQLKSGREAALFTKPAGWIDNPVKDKFVRSFYTSNDPGRRLTVLVRTIFAPGKTAYGWAGAEVKSITSKVQKISQPQSVSIEDSEWVVIEWENILNSEKGKNTKGQQYYSKKGSEVTLIEVSVMGSKEVFANVGTKEIYDFLANAKITSRSIDQADQTAGALSIDEQGELKNKSKPAVAEDIIGAWEMFYQKNTDLMPESEPFGYPYQRFNFFEDGYVKNMALNKPFDKLALNIWETAPKSTTYKFLKPGFLLMKQAEGYKYLILVTAITENFIEPLRPGAPKLKKGDLIFSYLSPKTQIYLERYLRKIDEGNKNNINDKIVFKTGESIECKIIERTSEYVKIDFHGAEAIHYLDEIESINGTSIKSLETKSQPNKVNETSELPFSTAVIRYEVSGPLYNGKEIVYIDAKNNRVSHDTLIEAKLGCAFKKINKRDLCDGKTLYHIDFEKGRAPSFVVKKGDAIASIFMEGIYSKYYQGQKEFLDKDCKVYSSMPGEEFYFWHGILLKMKTVNHPMGKNFNVAREAVEIKLNVPISEDKFNVPAGIKVISQEETMEKQWQKMRKDIEKIGEGTK